MLYEILKNKYKQAEPIFLNEVSGYSKDYVRQEMKRLTDEGKIERVYNGVYFIPYTTILGTKGKMSVSYFINKKFINVNGKRTGYFTGLQLANILGFTTQNPSCYEISTNEATTKQRKITVDGMNYIIYKPVVEINDFNYKELQFLDLMLNIDKYSELSKLELTKKLKKYIKNNNLNFVLIKEYINYYPDKIFRNFYYGGIINELV